MTRFIFKIMTIEVGLALTAAGLLLVPLYGRTRQTSKLKVRVTHARNAKGTIGIPLFQDATGFPENSSKAFRVKQTEINPETASGQAVKPPAFDEAKFSVVDETNQWPRSG